MFGNAQIVRINIQGLGGLMEGTYVEIVRPF